MSELIYVTGNGRLAHGFELRTLERCSEGSISLSTRQLKESQNSQKSGSLE